VNHTYSGAPPVIGLSSLTSIKLSSRLVVPGTELNVDIVDHEDLTDKIPVHLWEKTADKKQTWILKEGAWKPHLRKIPVLTPRHHTS
jgi:hypothetical protein